MHRPRPQYRRIIAISAFLSLLSLPTQADQKAPSGTLIPRRGPWAGQECRYGDGSHEYTRISEYTAAELEAYFAGKKKPAPLDVALLIAHRRDWEWPLQLSREGFEHYQELLLKCLEQGKFDKDKLRCRQRAPYPIGINIQTGKATAEYEAGKDYLYWLVEPSSGK